MGGRVVRLGTQRPEAVGQQEVGCFLCLGRRIRGEKGRGEAELRGVFKQVKRDQEF